MKMAQRATEAKGEAIDPVCGMETARTTHRKSEYLGTVYYFCSDGCKQKFDAAPAQFVKAKSEEGGRHEPAEHAPLAMAKPPAGKRGGGQGTQP